MGTTASRTRKARVASVLNNNTKGAFSMRIMPNSRGPLIEKLIRKYSKQIDANQGGDELLLDNTYKAEEELARISKALRIDNPKYIRRLEDYLLVVQSHLLSSEAKKAGDKNAKILHTKYMGLEKKYFLKYSESNYKKVGYACKTRRSKTRERI